MNAASPRRASHFCENRCMLQSCLECSFLLQLYGTGCGNIRVYYLCRQCYERRIARGFVEPQEGGVSCFPELVGIPLTLSSLITKGGLHGSRQKDDAQGCGSKVHP